MKSRIFCVAEPIGDSPIDGVGALALSSAIQVLSSQKIDFAFSLALMIQDPAMSATLSLPQSREMNRILVSDHSPSSFVVMLRILVLLALTVALSTADEDSASPLQTSGAIMSLQGPWQFRLDPRDEGLSAGWAAIPLPDHIDLPTTTDLAGFGGREKDPDPGFLSREHKYMGAAWYRREIIVPDGWRDRVVELFLERVLWESRAWVDGRECGVEDSLGTPHVHRLGKLSPGRHILTLRIDNRMIHPIGDRGHGYTEYTQTIWNGVVGRIELRARPAVAVGLVRVFAEAAAREVAIEFELEDGRATPSTTVVQLAVRERATRRVVASQTETVEPPAAGVSPAARRVTLKLADAPQLWDEFTPNLYEAVVAPGTGPGNEERVIVFGFRALTRDGGRLLVNGRPTFLRGNLDCAQYPRTGHPPTDVESWRKVFRVYHDYGLNHVRFHSWCPPEAAFAAADEMGLYLLAEVLWIDGWMGGPNPRADMDTPGYPRGVGKGDRTIDAYVRAETRRMLDAYGNHPSFCFFAIGNELGSSDFKVMGDWMREEKERDPRRFYAASTARAITPADDFSDTHHIPGVGSVVNNLGVAHTDWDYESSYRRAPVPIIAHEMGQMPVYPDWREIAKYQGPVRARNFELFREMARTNGVADQSGDFQAASGALNRLLYKNEMEAQLRSPGCAGVSWLSMQDFPGQREALVGWLDVFYENKGFVSPEQFRRYSAATVPLARFSKFVWTTNETFRATAQVSHWGASPLTNAHASWTLRDAQGASLARGEFKPADLLVGRVTTVGTIEVNLARVPAPQRMNLEISLAGAASANDWNVWVFPEAGAATASPGIVTTESPAQAWDELERGGRVLLLAHKLGDANNSRLAAWMPLFWSARFFPGQDRDTLGALVQAAHPALALFPTDRHLDWQWREICQGAHGFVLDDQPAEYRPIVQPVSDYHFNHKLGAVFEFAAGHGGRLLVCGYDLVNNLGDRPAAAQLRRSLLSYMEAPAFAPRSAISRERFGQLFLDPARPVSSSSWPQFRGPNGSGVADGCKPPLKLEPDRPAWKTAIAPGESSPILWNDRVFLTAVEDGRLATMAFEAGSGRVLWRQVAPEVRLEAVHSDNSAASSTPCADADRVYAYFGSYGLLCYSHDGAELWRKEVPRPQNMYGVSISPIVYEQQLILLLDDDANLPESKLSRSKVVALNKTTGEVLWETARPYNRGAWSTPMVWKHELGADLVVLGDGRMYGYDPLTGAEKWSVRGFAREPISVPVAGRHRLYASASMQGGRGDAQLDPAPFWAALQPLDRNGDGKIGRDEITPDFTLPLRPELALGQPGWGVPLPSDPQKRREAQERMFDMRDKNKDGFWTREEFTGDMTVGYGQPLLVAVRPGGSGDVTGSHVDWSLRTGIPEIPSPLYHEERLYLVRDGGILTCVDAATGKVVYRQRLGPSGQYSASPVLANGHLYLFSTKGVLSVVKCGDQFELVHQVDFKTRVSATPAIGPRAIYIRTDEALIGFQ